MSERQVLIEELSRRLLGTKYDSLDDYWVNCVATYLPVLGIQRFGIYVIDGNSIERREHGLDGFDIHSVKQQLPPGADYIELQFEGMTAVAMNSENVKWVVVVVETTNFPAIRPIVSNFEVPLLQYD